MKSFVRFYLVRQDRNITLGLIVKVSFTCLKLREAATAGLFQRFPPSNRRFFAGWHRVAMTTDSPRPPPFPALWLPLRTRRPRSVGIFSSRSSSKRRGSETGGKLCWLYLTLHANRNTHPYRCCADMGINKRTPTQKQRTFRLPMSFVVRCCHNYCICLPLLLFNSWCRVVFSNVINVLFINIDFKRLGGTSIFVPLSRIDASVNGTEFIHSSSYTCLIFLLLYLGHCTLFHCILCEFFFFLSQIGLSVDGNSLCCPRSELFWGRPWTARDRLHFMTSLFIYSPQLWDSPCLLTFAWLSCGMLIIHPMLCWFQECRGGRQTFPSDKTAMGK